MYRTSSLGQLRQCRSCALFVQALLSSYDHLPTVFSLGSIRPEGNIRPEGRRGTDRHSSKKKRYRQTQCLTDTVSVGQTQFKEEEVPTDTVSDRHSVCRYLFFFEAASCCDSSFGHVQSAKKGRQDRAINF